MSSLRSRARVALAPFNRALDSRLGEINRRIDAVGGALSAWAARTGETEELLGRSLSEVAALVDRVVEDNEAIRAGQGEVLANLVAAREEITWLTTGIRTHLPSVSAALGERPVQLTTLDDLSADFLNRATGYRGLAAEAGVFVNEPVIVHYRAGAVEVTDVNERIVELPFVFRGLAGVPAGSNVVDIGSSESTVSLSLASLGHQVTSVDPRGYAFAHPNITNLSDISEAPDGRFDVAVLLSTIEHVGVAHYGQDADPDADLALMRVLATKMAPGGRLLLTTPYGDGRDGGFQRIYDASRLAQLVEPFEIVEFEIAQRSGALEWTVTTADPEHLPIVTDDEYRVAMIVATVRS